MAGSGFWSYFNTTPTIAKGKPKMVATTRRDDKGHAIYEPVDASKQRYDEKNRQAEIKQRADDAVAKAGVTPVVKTVEKETYIKIITENEQTKKTKPSIPAAGPTPKAIVRAPSVNTSGVKSDTNEAPVTPEINPLHRFSSFNYLFTLSALPHEQTGFVPGNSSFVETASNDFVILKSSGKTTSGITKTFDTSQKSVIEEYNKNNSGIFDFFINNVEIETIMGFSKNTNLAMGTKIRFDVFEPYSFDGFREALYFTAKAAGNESYLSAPFILKIEFKGYLDNEKGIFTNQAVNIGNTTRYFVIKFTKMEISSNENGTTYKCSAIPLSELAYGDHNNTKDTIKVKGSTVGEVFKNLSDTLNTASRTAWKSESKGTSVTDDEYDTYQIIAPIPAKTGKYNYDKSNKDIFDKKIMDDPEGPAIYAFPKPGKNIPNSYVTTMDIGDECPDGYVKTPDLKLDKSKVTMQFPTNSKIVDLISSIVRDSEYGKDILKNKTSVIKDQTIPYAHVAVETKQKSFNKIKGDYAYEYRYTILPYEMHHSRVPLFQGYGSKSDYKALEGHTKRQYKYLYMGQNVDIRSFNIQFNHLFYQGYPKGVSNPKSGGAAQKSWPQITSDGSVPGLELKEYPNQDSHASTIPLSGKRSDPRVSSDIRSGSETGNQLSALTYNTLVKSMHDAIITNTDMITCEIEILGDPYFLVTGGIGGTRPNLTDKSITANGEAPYQIRDVFILLQFQNPTDVDSLKVNAKNKSVEWSGIYRVQSAVSKFSDGLFTQRLKLVRIPGQWSNTSNTAIGPLSVNITDDTYIAEKPVEDSN